MNYDDIDYNKFKLDLDNESRGDTSFINYYKNSTDGESANIGLFVIGYSLGSWLNWWDFSLVIIVVSILALLLLTAMNKVGRVVVFNNNKAITEQNKFILDMQIDIDSKLRELNNANTDN